MAGRLLGNLHGVRVRKMADQYLIKVRRTQVLEILIDGDSKEEALQGFKGGGGIQLGNTVYEGEPEFEVCNFFSDVEVVDEG